MSDTQETNGSGNITTKLGLLRSDFETLQKDVKGLASGVSDLADERVRRAVRNAESVAERSFHLAEESATNVVNGTTAWTARNTESVRKSIRSQPISAIAVSIGIGALFAGLWRRL
jgi:ElaB/YqjD/DUF883 family membrane-anchored ribosome-binding protein